MIKFFRQLLFYFTLIFFVYLFSFSATSYIFNENYIYKIPPGKTTLILGNSHTTVSINDSLSTNTFNLSNLSDLYTYSYAKLRKVLPLNPGIHTLLLSCSEQDITARNENVNLRLISDDKINNYFYLMTPGELFYMVLRNPEMSINALAGIPKSCVSRCVDIIRSKVKLRDLSLGGYQSTNGTINIEKQMKKLAEDNDDLTIISQRQVEYIHKIVLFCAGHHVKVIFIRPPEYKLYPRKNEAVFLNLLHTQFKEIPFKDYVNMALPDSCYKDMDHLNHYGAAIFTDTVCRYLNSIDQK
jgi:hypothetical protein